MGVDGDQDTWFSANIVLAKCFTSGALPRTSAGGLQHPPPQTAAGKRWVRPLQRAPQNCGPQGPDTPRSAIATGCSVRLRSIRWFERSRARSALFPSSAMNLDQSDGRGTDSLFFFILRRIRWRCLHLVLGSALIDSSWYLSNTTLILWYFVTTLNAVPAKMLA